MNSTEEKEQEQKLVIRHIRQRYLNCKEREELKTLGLENRDETAVAVMKCCEQMIRNDM